MLFKLLSIDFSLSAISLLVIVAAAALVGFACRSRQLRKKQLRIVELKKEMIHNHAYILELQKEYVALEMKLQSTETPVLQISTAFKNAFPENEQEFEASAQEKRVAVN